MITSFRSRRDNMESTRSESLFVTSQYANLDAFGPLQPWNCCFAGANGSAQVLSAFDEGQEAVKMLIASDPPQVCLQARTKRIRLIYITRRNKKSQNGKLHTVNICVPTSFPGTSFCSHYFFVDSEQQNHAHKSIAQHILHQ